MEGYARTTLIVCGAVLVVWAVGHFVLSIW